MVEVCNYCDSPTWCEKRADGSWQCLACKVERFFEKVLFAPIGHKLQDWHRKCLREIYGNVDLETGYRKYRRAYISVAKGNGKSNLIGGLPIYHMLMENERYPKVYGAAVMREQAGIVFDYTVQMIKASPILRGKFRIVESQRRINLVGREGYYRVLASADGGNDGIKPTLNLIDELHEWRNAACLKTYDNMTRGTRSHAQPLSVQITTAGEVGASELCQQEHDMAEQIISGAVKNDRVYAAIWSADKDRIKKEPDFWKSREARVQANPSHEDHGGFLKDSELEADVHDAVNQPGKLSKYLRYTLNVWVTNEDRFISADEWAKGAVSLRAPLIGRECYIGVDLSSTIDLTAVVGVFPCPDGSYDLLPFFFMAEGQVDKRQHKDRVPYRQWQREEKLIVTQGDSVDRERVRNHIKWMVDTFNVREICTDPWQARELGQELSAEGMTVFNIPQGYAHCSEAIKKLKELCVNGKVRHANHPVLAWNADCATVQGDGRDNVRLIKPERHKHSKRIDGISATVNAIARAIVAAPQPDFVSFY